MARAGRIVSHANYLGNPDYFLVSVLQPCEPRKPHSPTASEVLFGLLSFLTTVGVSAVGVASLLRARKGGAA